MDPNEAGDPLIAAVGTMALHGDAGKKAMRPGAPFGGLCIILQWQSVDI